MFNKKTVIITIGLWIASTVVYYNLFNLLQSYKCRYSYNIPVYRIPGVRRIGFTYGESDKFLINTPGCYLPNYSKTLHFKETARHNRNCNPRLVFVNKTSDHEIMFRVERSRIKVSGTFQCCYKFVKRSAVPGLEDNRIVYSECKPFQNGDKTELSEETVVVSCILYRNKKKILAYEDAYLILKKKPTEMLKIQTKENVGLRKENWNILIIGLDTMSRARAYSSLPKTVRYFTDHKWLDYRGYHKVGFNTFPNVMSMLTGMNISRVYHSCAGDMDKCKDKLIWNAFREAGYVTAYGEDNLRLPDTFEPYNGFKSPPTDHYTRPFFLTGELQTGNYICAKSKPSPQHILEYAEQFVQAYKNDSFFAHFWINSCSHNFEYLPMLCEEFFLTLFDNLERTGALENTFIFFISDHGIRYGPMRKPRESYYEERLPMLFLWVPLEFRQTYPEEYYNLQLNQFRLTTPYDVHMTFWKLLKMSDHDVKIVPSEECPKCEGLTEEIDSERTCEDARIDEKWCSCHNMVQTRNDSAAEHSLKLAVTYVQKMALAVKTKPCSFCRPLRLKTVLRNDWYSYGNKSYYVVAFVLSPGDVGFEASVEHSGKEFNILPPTETISAYNVRGSCVVKRNDRSYCVCSYIKDCGSVKKKVKT